MVSKQDKQAARTAADLERRNSFGKKFAEIRDILTGAAKTAQDASDEVDAFDQKFTQKDIFDRLTNNGQAQGMFLTELGDIYVNASFLATGTIKSSNNRLTISLSDNDIKVDCSEISPSYYLNREFIIGDDRNWQNGIWGLSDHYGPAGYHSESFLITPWRKWGGTSFPDIWGFDTSLLLWAKSESVPDESFAVRIGEGAESKVLINGKSIEWVWNESRSRYELHGVDEG